MILQSLHQLYDDLSVDPDSGITPLKFAPQKISFKITLRPDSSLFGISPVREEASRNNYVRHIVPEHEVRSGSKILPQFLCDKASYCLGIDPESGEGEKFQDHFNAFKNLHLQAGKSIPHPHYQALCRFLDNWDQQTAESYFLDHPEQLAHCINFGIFDVQGGINALHELPEVKTWWIERELEATEAGQCLISGNTAPIARIHPKIKGFASAAALVGVQKNTSYESYGLEQGATAPTSDIAAFKYAAALNWLLDGKGREKHRFFLADTTCVFWTDQPSMVTDCSPFIMIHGSNTAVHAQDEDQRKNIEVFLKALRAASGSAVLRDFGENPEETDFYLLGLEQPNPGRLSIRFFFRSSVAEFLENLRAHFKDIEIVREYETPTNSGPGQPEFPTIRDLLNQTAVRLSSGKLDYKTIPPLLGGALIRSILQKTPYPEGLYSAVIRRIRSDRTINYYRAAILKGVLTRNPNYTQLNPPTMLDTTIKQPSYLLGRLFAALEQSQRQAHDFKLDRTIRESFFSSAAATPASVFPRIQKLHIHHLRKLGRGSQKFFEDLICEILSKIEKTPEGHICFPKTLSLEEQGGFSIGYYQQLVSLKPKKESSPEDSE